MKGLPTLIRLHRWRLDGKRKRLAELERLAAELDDQRRQLEAELGAEQEVAKAFTEAALTYDVYAKAVIMRRENLAQSIADTKSQIERWALEVMESFQDVKRYELAQAHRQRAAEQQAARREQAVLDEVGAELYRRRNRG